MTNVIMLCHNRLRLLQQALRTLYDNTPREEFTLTLVNDASTDFRVNRALEDWAQAGNATLLTINKSAHVLARGKNLGAFWSEQSFGQGEWLYFSDSDVAFTPGWLGTLTDVARQVEFAGFKLFGGQAHPFHHGKVTGLEYGDQGKLLELEVLDGPSWLMRWSTWDKVGKFSRDCAPGTCQSEDAEWCARLVKAGGRIGVVHPHAVLHTGLTNTSGADAPGRKEREAGRVAGYVYE